MAWRERGHAKTETGPGYAGGGSRGRRCVLSRCWGGRGVSGDRTGAGRRWRGVGRIVSSASRKVMLDADVIRELEELAVPAAMPTGKPAGFGRM